MRMTPTRPFQFSFGRIGKILTGLLTRRNKILACIICTCLSLYFLLPYVLQIQNFQLISTKYLNFSSRWQRNQTFPEEDSSKFLINTPGCTIERTPIWPSYYKDNWHVENIPICDYETVLSDLSEDGILTLRPNYTNCCLHEINKVEGQDNRFVMSKCEEFNTSKPLDVSKKEILVTKCGRSLNFEANFPIGPTVQGKLNYWKNISKENHPPSVLFIGVDSMSRSHAFRSLPQTMDLMKEMGFADYKGYHSVRAVGTIFNFYGFLMGLSWDQVTGKSACIPGRKGHYDKCPFIWRDFSLQNYVTMYVEDAGQTFNYLPQAGFSRRPTDFYINALFNSIKALRPKYSPIFGKKEKIDCTSNETVPQFVARYTQRFTKTFQNVPRFSFTWFEDPFHNNPPSFPQLDKVLPPFLQFLNSNPDILENTLIVFVGDHGDRVSPFLTSSSSTEAYIEKFHPPLMIRFPKSLKTKFPNLDETLKTNTESLIGTYDIHQTFKHILSMAGKTSGNFEPVLPDRSSLLYPVSPNRTCQQLNIECCACGLSLDAHSMSNHLHLKKIVEFAQFKLNERIWKSKYASVCHNWTTSVDKVLQSRIFPNNLNGSLSDGLIQFLASPGNAKFEARIVFLNYDFAANDTNSCMLSGDFNRINLYGNQSHCVSGGTLEDTKMKELCMCK